MRPCVIEVFLRNRLNDPGSLSFQACQHRYTEDERIYVTQCSYRGKNAFGALILQTDWFQVSGAKWETVTVLDREP